MGERERKKERGGEESEAKRENMACVDRVTAFLACKGQQGAKYVSFGSPGIEECWFALQIRWA